jgi:DNA-binding PadR family transcriptional regulator
MQAAYRFRYSYMDLICYGIITMPRKHKDLDFERFAKPQGAPRGLLLHYILYKISQKPSHGYELLQEIEEKTEGAWRPGAGSIYPMLKKLVAQGYIKAESPKKLHTFQRVYHITPEGKLHVAKTKEMFSNAGHRWSLMRKIFIDMLEPKDLSKFFVEGAKMHFDATRDVVDSKISAIPSAEAEFILKEYALNLQRQLDWSNEVLRGLKHTKIATEAKIASK